MTTTTTTTTPTLATTDLDVIEKTALVTLAKSAAKDDLDDLLRGARRSLLLVDCSGSMGNYIATGGRRIDALRTVVASLRETHPVPVAAFGANGPWTVVVDDIPEPDGSTPLAGAIDFGREQGATHLVIVTDGCPDDAGRAYEAARRFGNPIDTFFIGNRGEHGASFCAELARMTGGTAHLNDLGKPKELASQIRLMIGDGSN